MMMETTDNFDKTLKNITKISPITIQLFPLVCMLVYGHGASNRSFSQPAFTLVQLIHVNFHRNRNNEVQSSREILRYIEAPATLCSIVKIYGTF